eukprot:CAMPEP_0116145438 /NCGR_PEP_ID=MMETSP0329-20121206/16590_1 /TAXON_ID=697910 /ORGANISM="Pseudo-nitzschia arenysensis, Strain B593" /LENGTH=551 /DNA_ID=CAMNT_0003641037 /DNA_START=25 /DNA_END=1680 /DNA_ORIENTATION=-
MIRVCPRSGIQRSIANIRRLPTRAGAAASSSSRIIYAESRQFSSKGSDNDSKSGKKLSGPVIIGRTARSKRSRGRGPHMHPRGGESKQDSMISHIISGGTPLDPAPPPFELANFGEDSVYTLVLLRHGESEWNKLNQYTGWCDVKLTKKGEVEARSAGRLLFENGIEIDHAFTSVLKRASFSCNMALNMANQHWVPVTKSWRLNERHYGALQGYHKDKAYKELGLDQELVMQMRRSYDVRPPRMEDDHPYWHGNYRRYRKLSKEQLESSRTESLKDAADRIMPFYNSVIAPSLRAGNKCLIVSHANTIRTLIKNIDGISDEDIKGMSIPTGIPLLYRLDKNLKPVCPVTELEFRFMVEPKGYTWGTDMEHGFNGVYLGDLERLQDIQSKRDITNRNWQRIILYNIAKALHEDDVASSSATTTETTDENKSEDVKTDANGESPFPKNLNRKFVLETRQLWFKLHEKMQSPEYGNMLLLVRMRDELEHRMYQRKQRYLTFAGYEELVNKLHLDAEGHVVEPFVALSERKDREERQKMHVEAIAQDLEEECLIR